MTNKAQALPDSIVRLYREQLHAETLDDEGKEFLTESLNGDAQLWHEKQKRKQGKAFAGLGRGHALRVLLEELGVETDDNTAADVASMVTEFEDLSKVLFIGFDAPIVDTPKLYREALLRRFRNQFESQKITTTEAIERVVASTGKRFETVEKQYSTYRHELLTMPQTWAYLRKMKNTPK